MDITLAGTIARELMNQHGLHDWRFFFDRSVERFGLCSSRRKFISMSKALTELNSEAEVRDTILHEIAHALEPGQHHSRRWKLRAISVGARPQACYSSHRVQPVPHTVTGECLDCGSVFHRHRMPHRDKFHTRCRHQPYGGLVEWTRN